MKKLLSILLTIAVVFVFSAATPVSDFAEQNSSENNTTIQQENTNNGVIEARFENMLNHNFVYGEDFYSDKAVIENSILALLDYSEDGEIEQNLVLQFIANMYGRQVDPTAAEYDFLPASEGKFAILPRGYEVYTHKVVSVESNEFGYTVISNMLIEYHYDETETVQVKTEFVINEGSSFGYNIISSEILESANSLTA